MNAQKFTDKKKKKEVKKKFFDKIRLGVVGGQALGWDWHQFQMVFFSEGVMVKMSQKCEEFCFL